MDWSVFERMATWGSRSWSWLERKVDLKIFNGSTSFSATGWGRLPMAYILLDSWRWSVSDNISGDGCQDIADSMAVIVSSSVKSKSGCSKIWPRHWS